MRSTEHIQFRNNLFLLFEARRIQNHFPDHIIIRTYLEHAETYGQSWQEFLNKNVGLLNLIDEALYDLQPYKDLRKHYKLLLKQGKIDEAEKFNENNCIEAIGNNKWNKLNILLAQAEKALIKEGINPQEFYK